jgi:hypothetical protein
MIPVLFVVTCMLFRKGEPPIQYSKQALIDECERMGVSTLGTPRILRHRIKRLKDRGILCLRCTQMSKS